MCLAICGNLLRSSSPSAAKLLRQSSLADLCIGIACTHPSVAVKYDALQVLALAAPLPGFRAKVSAPGTLTALAAALLQAMDRSLIALDISAVFFVCAHLLCHGAVSQFLATEGGTQERFGDAVLLLIADDNFLRQCSLGMQDPGMAYPYVFAMHSLASFPDSLVHENLQARIRETPIPQQLLDLSSLAEKDEVMEMALLALGSLVGCSVYFSHVSARVLEAQDRRSSADQLSEEERQDLVVAERLAETTTRTAGDQIIDAGAASSELRDGLKNMTESIYVKPLLMGVRGIPCCVAVLRLLQLFGRDKAFATRLIAPHAQAMSADSHDILAFATIVPTLVLC
jgi:hypothetical protein